MTDDKELVERVETAIEVECPFTDQSLTLDEIREIAKVAIAECFRLRPMKDAKRDGTHILLHTTSHGLVEAWFSKGYWSEETPETPREYSGSVWVCADDTFQIAVEEDGASYHDGTATGWLPLPKVGGS